MLEGKLSDEIDLTDLVRFVPFSEQKYRTFSENKYPGSFEDYEEV